ncbi:MAG: ChaN family lipoprotein [Bacteroidetes bacterium]|nr:ChaN family lipoprotein [Bacteroidota bacterium]
MRKSLLLIALVPFFMAADLPAYKMFTGQGESRDFDEMVKAAAKADVVLFGEFHNNPIAHWLQIELTKALHKEKKKKLVLGAEMFESDNQLILDEYLSGTITTSKFETEARIWPNYKTDYKPLVEFAKDNELVFVASNIPRRYAGVVAKDGLDALNDLSDMAKSYIAPLPVEVDSTLPNYNALLHMGMSAHGASQNFMSAQAIKDATMAHFIQQNRVKKGVFLHYNGAYHSNNYEGISWYLKKQDPEIKILTISCVEQDDVTSYKKEERTLADFVITIPTSMTKTH